MTTTGRFWVTTEERAIVEAFPNAFLGVMLPVKVFQTSGQIARGKRFDHLYDAVCDTGLLDHAVAYLRTPIPDLARRMISERDHEKRAAWICLMTAAFAVDGTATTVGDSMGGWFWLPPWDLWSDWAQIALAESLKTLRSKGLPVAHTIGACPA